MRSTMRSPAIRIASKSAMIMTVLVGILTGVEVVEPLGDRPLIVEVDSVGQKLGHCPDGRAAVRAAACPPGELGPVLRDRRDVLCHRAGRQSADSSRPAHPGG